MKTVSNTYLTSMNKPFRNNSHLNVGISKEDILPSDIASVTGENGSNLLSSSFQQYISEPNVDNLITSFAGELNEWVLDENHTITHSTYLGVIDHGYIGSTVYTTGTRDDVDVHVTLANSVSASRFYCTTGEGTRITLYSGGSMVSMAWLGTLGYIDLPERVTFDSFDIHFEYNFAPYSRARLQNVFVGVKYMFKDADIVEASWTNEIDPISRRLPTNTFKFSLLDFEGKYDPLNVNGEYRFLDTDMDVFFEYGYDIGGVTEWLPREWYRLNSKPTYQDYKATFTAEKMWSAYEQTNYQATPHNNTFLTNLGDRFKDMCTTYNIPNATSNTEYTRMNTYPCSVPTKAESVKSCMQLMAHATGSAIYFDEWGNVDLKPFVYNQTNFQLTKDNILNGTESITINPNLKQLKMKVYSATRGDSNTTLDNLSIDVGANTIDYISPLDITTLSYAGFSGTLWQRGYYGMEMDVSSVTGTCSVTAKPLNIANTVFTLTCGTSGDIDTEDNYLITDRTKALDLANNTIVPFLKKRNVFSLSYRGNPELEVGDVVTYVDRYNVSHRAVILSHSILFNGAIRGTMVLKEI